jgi:hypothetical protein
MPTPAEPATMELVQTLPLKRTPGPRDHLAIHHQHRRLFVANLSKRPPPCLHGPVPALKMQ